MVTVAASRACNSFCGGPLHLPCGDDGWISVTMGDKEGAMCVDEEVGKAAILLASIF